MLVQGYASERGEREGSGGGAIFMKEYGKVHKMEEVVEWSSRVRQHLYQQCREGGEIELEGFSSKGTTRKVVISFDQY